MATSFEHQEPLNVLGFCKSAPTPQHGGPHLPLIDSEPADGEEPGDAAPSVETQALPPARTRGH